MSIEKESLSKIAVKNSIYSLTFATINKIGGLILTIILARILLPELFGIYSLVLSVIVIIVIFTDAGIDNTGIRYMSKALTKKNKKQARSFFRYVFKIKGVLTLASIIIILIIAKPLSQIYNKPLLFLPLIFSCFYIFSESLRSFFTLPFSSKKQIKILIPAEIVFDLSRIILPFIAISLLSYELKVSGLFLALFISGILFFLVEFFFLMKTDKKIMFGELIKIDKKRILKYMVFMGIAGITLVFFGSIDTLILGIFVDAAHLGFYRAALTLVVSISAILPFSSVLLPIFTQINGKRLDRGFKKSLKYLIIITIPMSVGVMFLSRYIIYLIYGNAYLSASSSLLVLSILIIVSPLISLYSTIFQSQEKPNVLTKFIILSLVMNIFLNYFFIRILLHISQEYALLGAAVATLISNFFLLGILVKKTKSQFRIGPDKKIILKSIFSSIIMAIFLFIFKIYVDINILSGFIMIIISAMIYFSVMFFIKGILKEDLNLLKTIFRK